MTVAAQKKRSHIVDYLLFTWQMEDLVRAAQFQPRLLEEWAENQANSEGTDPVEESKWLLALAEDMRRSGAEEKGHAGSVKDAMAELAHLHELLLGTLNDARYREAFNEAEPYLKDLGEKSPNEVHPVEQLALALAQCSALTHLDWASIKSETTLGRWTIISLTSKPS